MLERFRVRGLHPGLRTGALLAVLGAALLVTSVASAEPPYPRYGSRIVDGDYSDWNLTADYYDSMYRAGRPEKPLESWLYLRYDCTTYTLYVLVRGRPSVPVITDPTGAWVAVNVVSDKAVNGSSGDDGKAPDFAWIELVESPLGTVAAGYEASFTLPPGGYNLIVHANVYDDGGEQTSATAGSPKDGVAVILDCAVPVKDASWGTIKALYK